MDRSIEWHPAVRGYIDAVLGMAEQGADGIVSIALFGSVAKGGFSEPASDVDLMVALADDAPKTAKKRVRRQLRELELKHGFGEPPRTFAAWALSPLDRLVGQRKSFFVCRESDLLAGKGAVVLGWRPLVECLFSTRIIFANIAVSAKTAWGKPLFEQATLKPIGRRHLTTNLAAFVLVDLIALASFAFNPKATKYAMSATKWMLHNCHFCHSRKPATLAQEIAFFEVKLGPRPVFSELVSLRRDYRHSLGFVFRSVGVLFRLYWTTLRDLDYPIRVVR